ncbi:UDP-N-acetylmuramate dehydrogenase [Candidatus Saccharibacteria bacterium]|nr:UDP-N-acetylmuramate dehydrogenase [Candidatus Saccharibacteria bacterium]
MKIRENVPIAEITTMRLGGEVKFLVDVEQQDDVSAAFEFAEERGLPFFFLGEGANSIGKDDGLDGVIIRNKIEGIQVVDEEKMIVKGMGGEIWDNVVNFTTDLGWSGIEAMSAIPGTLGAAPVQNIGAYGQDISQVIVEVEAFDTMLQEFVTIPKSEMKMGYRTTIFNTGENAGRYFIVAVTMQLKHGNLEPPFYTSLQKFVDEHGIKDFSPANIREMVTKIREDKLPNPKKQASAGSFFKNIYLTDEEADAAEKRGIQVFRTNGENTINTGWLIEQAGLKGKEFFGFRVSEKAALILINENARTYAELEHASGEIKRVVKEKFGFELEQEPVEIVETQNSFGKPDLLDPKDNCLGAAL